MLIEYRTGDATRQAVVPETTVPHDADRLVWQRVAHPRRARQ